MKKPPIITLLLFGCVLIMASCKKDDNKKNKLDDELNEILLVASNTQSLDFFRLPASNDFNAIPQDPLNTITDEKVELGKLLYHESGIALGPKMDISKGTYSCASCHFASAGFQANRVQGISEGGIGFGQNGEGRQPNPMYPNDSLDVQPIRTPSSMNNAYQTNLLWNGQFGATGLNDNTEYAWKAGTPIETNFLGYEGLETQAIAGLKVHRMKSDTAFFNQSGYKAMFDAAFPDVDESERYDREYMGLAIAAYERTILSNQAPFQKWLKGEYDSMSDAEKRGAILFFDKGNCNSCHTGPALSSMEFHAIGMNDLFECPEDIFQASLDSDANLGRGSFTGANEDMYKFKVPQLYNLKDSPFFGHGSSFRNIRDVMVYKNNASPENQRVPTSQLASDFVPLNLTDEEIDDITAFLENALRDPNLMRYQPTSVLSGNCIPFNDPAARQDLGCN